MGLVDHFEQNIWYFTITSATLALMSEVLEIVLLANGQTILKLLNFIGNKTKLNLSLKMVITVFSCITAFVDFTVAIILYQNEEKLPFYLNLGFKILIVISTTILINSITMEMNVLTVCGTKYKLNGNNYKFKKILHCIFDGPISRLSGLLYPLL